MIDSISNPFAPAIDPRDEALSTDESSRDRLACPACGERGVGFWRVWAVGSLASPTCSSCGAHLTVHKTGILKFGGYAIGGALGLVVIRGLESDSLSWWAFGVLLAAGLVLDAWCDSRVVHFSVKER